MNVAIYGPGGRFCMADRGRNALGRSAEAITIGPSRMGWEDGRLVMDVDEPGSLPQLGRLSGRITVTPAAITGVELPLTPDGAHVWRPFAPVARIAVDLGPGGRWEGDGYFDANFGTRALEADFNCWTWGRYPGASDTTCLYDAVRRDGTTLAAAFRFDCRGEASAIPPPPKARLPRSLWAVRRETRADAGTRPRQVLPMLDAPFYTRAAVKARLAGEDRTGVHEALDLRRFAGPWLMPMLAVRVPRIRRWPRLPAFRSPRATRR